MLLPQGPEFALRNGRDRGIGHQPPRLHLPDPRTQERAIVLVGPLSTCLRKSWLCCPPAACNLYRTPFSHCALRLARTQDEEAATLFGGLVAQRSRALCRLIGLRHLAALATDVDDCAFRLLHCHAFFALPALPASLRSLRMALTVGFSSVSAPGADRVLSQPLRHLAQALRGGHGKKRGGSSGADATADSGGSRKGSSAAGATAPVEPSLSHFLTHLDGAGAALRDAVCGEYYRLLGALMAKQSGKTRTSLFRPSLSPLCFCSVSITGDVSCVQTTRCCCSYLPSAMSTTKPATWLICTGYIHRLIFASWPLSLIRVTLTAGTGQVCGSDDRLLGLQQGHPRGRRAR